MIPLFSTEQVRKADSFAINKLMIPGIVLMENAAISIKNEIFREFHLDKNLSCIGIICGKGNNGGDGYALARQLLADGYNVNVIALADEKVLKGDALTNYLSTKKNIQYYRNSKLTYFRSLTDLKILQKCDIIVDAILGTGSVGELKEPYKSIINNLNGRSSIKVALDNPTGLNLVNASGNNIFRSDLTVTLAQFKTGLFYEKGYHFSGKTVKGSIGIGNSYFDNLSVNEYLIEPEDVFYSIPDRQIDSNKYSSGKVFVIAGSEGMPGAAIFAINAAMISGAGSGYLAVPRSINSISQTQMNSAIVQSYGVENTSNIKPENVKELIKKINWADAIAIGPGMGREDETQSAILKILVENPNKKFVIDADAIFALRNKKYRKLKLSNFVFTPHHNEFAQLLGIDLRELKVNILKYGRKFVSETKSHLILKGAPTLIFNPNGEVFINSSGNSGLAKFGTGDVLTGIITSFIAQNKEIEKSLIASVYLHSLTADLIVENESEFGISPNKLINSFPETIKFLRNSIV